MSKEKRVPEIRFKEFSGEWESKILGELGTFHKGSLLSKKDLSDDGKPCILYGELYTTYSEVTNNVISKTNITNKKLIYSKKGDVLIPSSGETALDISTATCLLQDNIALGGDLNIFRSKSLDGRFISYSLNHKQKTNIAALAQGVSVVHLYNSQLQRLKINIPIKDEQIKIADFLSTIDEKISNQQEQIDILENLKKGYIQKIFSQEFRFRDDYGNEFPDWKKKKGSQIFKSISDKKHNCDYPVLSVTQDKGVVNREELEINIKYDKKSMKNYKKVKYSDFIISLRSFQGGIETSYIEGLVSPAYTVFNFNEPSEMDTRFFMYYFKSENFIRLLKTIIYGIRDGKAISYTDFSSLTFQYPSKIEQTKISSFLSLLDKKIEIEKGILEHWKQIKKGLLQKMFV